MQQQLNVQILEPDGPSEGTFVLAHGYGCDQSMWADVCCRLTNTRRILFDWAGAGRSALSADDPKRHARLDGCADDLLALLGEMDLQDVMLVGHAVGASIAMLAASRQPVRPAQLAVVGPSPFFENDPPGYMGCFERAQLHDLVRNLGEGHAAWSRAMAPVVMGNPDRPALTLRLTDSICEMDPTIALRWAQATFLTDLRPLAPKLQVPAVIMRAQDDALASTTVGRWLHENLQQGMYVPLQATGHCPHVIAPGEVADVLTRTHRWRGQLAWTCSS